MSRFDGLRARLGAWMPYLMLSLILLAFLGAVWNMYVVRQLKAEVLGRLYPVNLFMTTEGWRVGQLAPAMPVRALDGQSTAFRTVAEEHDIVYLAADTCRTCKSHFPHLNRAAAELKAAGGSFAMVSLMRETTLPALQEQHGFVFPVYEVSKSDLTQLNVTGTPTVFLFRRGVLVEVFGTGSLDRLMEQLRTALKGLPS